MEWVETTGRTIEEALDAALDELGVDEDEVEFEVLEQPRGGLFGRFGGGARIRARVKPLSREKPGERQHRRRRGGSGPGRSPRGEGDQETARGARGAAESTEASTVRGSSAGRRGGQGAKVAREQGTGSAPERQVGSAPERRPRSRSGSTGNQSIDETTKGTTVETTESEVAIEEQAEAAEVFTRGLIDAFDLGGEVTTVLIDDGILVEVTGDGLGLLVGPRGATLHAIEELVRTVVQRQTDGHGARINVDVAGYRAKRREALQAFTRGIAERVLETGTAQTLEPMSAVDRKTVHDAAAEIDGVRTESRGEDPRRCVAILPETETS
jgi:spoIIIJ-associated protein